MRSARIIRARSIYLDALDWTVRKNHERPSIGLLLCASGRHNER